MTNMKKLAVSFIVIILFLSGCATAPKLSPMQKRQITTRVIEGSYETVYQSILTVLQDQGYIIKNTDMRTGLISANIDRESSTGSQAVQALFLGYVSNKGSVIDASIMVNKINNDKSEVRINMQESQYGQNSSWGGTSKQNVETIYDKEIYGSLFNEIQIEVKRRNALGRDDNIETDDSKE